MQLAGHGAVVVGKVSSNFITTLPASNAPRARRHDAHFFFYLFASLRYTIAGAFAECFSLQKADAMVCRVSTWDKR
jgi:hypothetical protein